MREFIDICSRHAEARREGRAAALATVVSVSGSTYRRPGARMLMTDDGQWTGCVSGGCLERDVRLRARQVMKSGESRVVTYDSTSDDDVVQGFGLGCHGVVHLLIEPLGRSAVDPISFISDCIGQGVEGVMATVFGTDGQIDAKLGERVLIPSNGKVVSNLKDDRLLDAILGNARSMVSRYAVAEYTLDNGRAFVLIERIEPPLPVYIFGAGYDAIPLMKLSRMLGWQVTVVDHRPTNLARARASGANAVVVAKPAEISGQLHLVARSAVVIMNHHYEDDLGTLRFALSTPAPYIGVLGPRRRTERMLADLATQGMSLTPEQTRRLYGPMGLDLGADNPDEIALSIAAEIQSVFAGRNCASLRDRPGPLHPRSEVSPVVPLEDASTHEVICAVAD